MVPLRERVAASFRDLAELTTFGGMIQVWQSRRRPLLCFAWVAVVAGMVAMTAWNTATVVDDYLSYPVTTKVTDVYNGALDFPTVMVCNRNPIPCTRLAKSYMKDRLTIGELFAASYCADTLSRKDTVNVLLLDPSQIVKSWRNKLAIPSLVTTIRTKEWVKMGVSDPAPCLKLLGVSSEAEVREKHLTVDVINKLLSEEYGCQAQTLGYALFRTSFVLESNTTAPKNPYQSAYSQDFVGTSFRPFQYGGRNNRTTFEVMPPLSAFILGCTFDGRNCLSEENFVQDIFPEHGACYSFNDPRRKLSLKVSDAGPRAGLSLEIFVDRYNYMPLALASGVGVKVAITHTEAPRAWPDIDGFNVRPGSEADFALKERRFIRLPSPYQSSCWGDWDGLPFEPVVNKSMALLSRAKSTNRTEGDRQQELVEPYSYAVKNNLLKSVCNLVCRTIKVAKACGCLDLSIFKPFVWKQPNDTIAKTYKKLLDKNVYCTSSDQSVWRCRTMILANATGYSDMEDCRCRPPCQEIQYRVIPTSTDWPSDVLIHDFVQKYKSQLTEQWIHIGENDSVLEQRAGKDLVRINIYFQSMNVETLEELPNYDKSDALSALGGALSLFLGLSGITLFEMGEALVVVFLSILGLANRRGLQSS